MNTTIRSGAAFMALFFLVLPLSALNVGGISRFQFTESDSLRAQIEDRWFSAPIDTVAALKGEIVEDPYGDGFEISVSKTDTVVSVTLIQTDRDEGSIAGRWTLNRDKITGEPVSIVVNPMDNPEIVLTLRPGAGSKSLLDLSVYGLYARKGVPFGKSFQSVLTSSVESIAALTARTVPWNLVHPDPLLYGNIAQGVETIRSRLPTLVYLEDGAFDDTGKPVFIESESPQDPKAVLAEAADGRDISIIRGGVNCSGFVKWIVDGIIRPTAGSGTFINSLKRWSSAPETGFTERYRESRDVFFALDWTRNLASAVVSLDAGHTVFPDAAGIDVKVEPFSGALGFETDVGYQVKELLPMLYWLAANEGGHWYLGALSRERGERGNAANPFLRYYHHAAAFFPWFDEKGQLRVAVFESAAETPVETFVERNRDAWVFLTRVDMSAPGRFAP